MKLVSVLFAIGITVTAASADSDILPHTDVVPDAKTAVKIARAVLDAVYGEENTDMEMPLVARLKDKDTWIVDGTLPAGLLGGVGELEIARHDGRILRLSHGQ